MNRPGRLRRLALAALALGSTVAAAPSPPSVNAHTWMSVLDWYRSDLGPGDAHGVPPDVEQSEVRIAYGDDLQWAAPNFDDSRWAIADRKTVLRKDTGIFWVRVRVRAVAPGHSVPAGVFLCETAAAEYYWDGVLVRELGKPGNDRAHEIAGPVYAAFDVPGTLLGAGEHVLAVRMSTHRWNRPDPTMNLVVLNVNMSRLAHSALTGMLGPVLGVGALLVIGIAAALFWMTADRSRGLLLFAGFSLGSALTVLSVDIRHLLPVPYPWSYPLWTATEVLTGLTAACLIGLLLVEFGFRRRKLGLAAFVGLELMAALRDFAFGHKLDVFDVMVDFWRAGLLVASGLALWAVARRRRGAGGVLAACALAAAIFFRDPEAFLAERYWLAMVPLLLAFLATMGLRLRDERRQAREARLAASRLELELLRKSLQPHFLMNTLTAVAQAIEENPARAVQLIEDLAAELRELGRFAEQKAVPLERELELCRAHLRVMSIRTERPWELQVEGTDPMASVPPALFFTLIENGFTHQQPIRGATRFQLRSEPVEGGRRYIFFSPGVVRPNGHRHPSGSGLRYVRARLEECCAGGWTFRHGPVSNGWETTVELRAAAGARVPS